MNSVEWTEVRQSNGYPETFFVIVEKIDQGWLLFDRSCWDVRWYSVKTTEAYKAQRLQKLTTCDQENPLTAGDSAINADRASASNEPQLWSSSK